jgi:hypothetical protein
MKSAAMGITNESQIWLIFTLSIDSFIIHPQNLRWNCILVYRSKTQRPLTSPNPTVGIFVPKTCRRKILFFSFNHEWMHECKIQILKLIFVFPDFGRISSETSWHQQFESVIDLDLVKSIFEWFECIPFKLLNKVYFFRSQKMRFVILILTLIN